MSDVPMSNDWMTPRINRRDSSSSELDRDADLSRTKTMSEKSDKCHAKWMMNKPSKEKLIIYQVLIIPPATSYIVILMSVRSFVRSFVCLSARPSLPPNL